MRPLAEIALRYQLTEVILKQDGNPDERVKVATAYDVHGKRLGLVTGITDAGASAGLMHGLPEMDSERWQWLEKGRMQVEQLLLERPELGLVSW